MFPGPTLDRRARPLRLAYAPLAIATASILIACHTTPAPRTAPLARSPALAPAHEALAALTTSPPRRGLLEVDGDTLRLGLPSGEGARPFLSVERRAFEQACWRSTPTRHDPDATIERRSSWWIFANETDAVAVEFAAYNAHFWFWDAQRGCPVRVTAFDPRALEPTAPPEFYKEDDAQIAYVWNYAYQDHISNRPVIEADGDRRAEIVESVPGLEQLIAERDFATILAADGTSLFRAEFDVDPQWPCYNSQLTVFEESDGGVYAITSFEIFGVDGSCNGVSRLMRYGSTIARWDAQRRQFVPRFSLVDQLQQPTPEAEMTDVRTWRMLTVDGGALALETRHQTENSETRELRCFDRDAATDVCLDSRSCSKWVHGTDRATWWTFQSKDGVTVPVGEARDLYREETRSCPARP